MIVAWLSDPFGSTYAGGCKIVSARDVAEGQMGGRGTRITFAGELDLKPGPLAGLRALEQAATSFVESIVTTIIPRNLRAMAEAAADFPLPPVVSPG
jgi:hypothetical protein